MTENIDRGRLLNQVVPADATVTTGYTVPAAGKYITFVSITNLTSAGVVASVKIAPAGVADDPKHAIKRVTVGAAATEDVQVGAALNEDDVIRVLAADDCAFAIWGR